MNFKTYLSYNDLGNNGRLGNQLFQIASTLGIAAKNKKLSLFPTSWKYIDIFSVPSVYFFDKIIEDIYSESGFQFEDIILETNKSYNLKGYLQSYKYFQNIETDIRNFFTFRKELVIKSEFCSVHIRRGDYLNLADYHTNLGLDYYKPAIEYMISKGVKTFAFFSDDIQWCKDNFSYLENAVFLSGSELDDFKSLCSASAAIIANSSFSWWGAYLSNCQYVIAPKNWFGPANSHLNTKDLYLPTWTQL